MLVVIFSLVGKQRILLCEGLLISSLPGKALRKLFDMVSLAEKYRILGECLLISSLPGKVADFNTPNKLVTQKLLKQGYW